MAETPGPHRAGLFDIRIIIGSLIGIYGAILVITGLFTSDSQQAKADGVNINLYTGIGMLLFAAGFVIWARLRPIVVPADPKGPEEGAADRPVH